MANYRTHVQARITLPLRRGGQPIPLNPSEPPHARRRLVRSGSGAWGGLFPALVSTPCRIKPCMRCSLTRLSDNLLPGACAIPDPTLAKPPATDFGREYTVVDPLAPGIAFAGVVVICGAGGIGPLAACTVTYLPALAWLKQGSLRLRSGQALPSYRVMLSR